MASHAAGASSRYYTITDLGTLGGDSKVWDLNANGDVAGSSDTANANTLATVYAEGQLYNLGTLGGSSSIAYAINDLGHPVGIANPAGATTAHAFVYYNGTMYDLGTLGGANSTATAINNNDFVVGQSDTTDGKKHAVAIDADGMHDLGTLGGDNSCAYGVNDFDQIVGSAQTDSGATIAFAISDGSTIPLGSLGGTSSTALAINNYAQIVGSSTLQGDGVTHGFLYSKGDMIDIGTLPGGYESSAADINDSGVVVGTSSTSAFTGLHAIIYEGGALTDLNILVPPGTGWLLEAAQSINSQGQIAGQGVNPAGQVRGFLLTPAIRPLPSFNVHGPKKITTSKSRVTIKGTADTTVTSVSYAVGKKKRTASGLSAWSFKVSLKPGRTVVKVVAHSLGGDSPPVRVTIVRH